MSTKLFRAVVRSAPQIVFVNSTGKKVLANVWATEKRVTGSENPDILISTELLPGNDWGGTPLPRNCVVPIQLGPGDYITAICTEEGEMSVSIVEE